MLEVVFSFSSGFIDNDTLLSISKTSIDPQSGTVNRDSNRCPITFLLDDLSFYSNYEYNPNSLAISTLHKSSIELPSIITNPTEDDISKSNKDVDVGIVSPSMNFGDI